MCFYKSYQQFLPVSPDRRLPLKGLKLWSHCLVAYTAIADAKYAQAQCEIREDISRVSGVGKVFSMDTLL